MTDPGAIKRLMILIPTDLLAAIDERRRVYPDLPPRTEAIRRLIWVGLNAGRRIDELEADKSGLQAQLRGLYNRGLNPPD